MRDYRIHFLYSSMFPELKLFPERRQARDALHIASRKIMRWSYALSVPLCFGTVFVGKWGIRTLSSVPSLLIVVTAGLFLGFVIGYLPLLVWSGPIRRSLREQLNAGGEEICVRCGYRLRGLIIARCPECGTEFASADVADLRIREARALADWGTNDPSPRN